MFPCPATRRSHHARDDVSRRSAVPCGLHFTGVYFLIQQLAPRIADGGSIVNISSVLARSAGEGWSIYGAMKGAVEVLTRYHTQELGKRGIRVNVVAPGPVATGFLDGTIRDNAAVPEMLGGQAALGRVAGRNLS
ncbi:SDR family oxidoreductase [Amycolatopsis sp. NPDC051373]|uniref:SDR family NAD(P)-dependent oxidoreductase n=1 Tax=Amycolatopsis sp. NPDC051373 TaxID=3155801 RepID=UPI00344E2D88